MFKKTSLLAFLFIILFWNQVYAVTSMDSPYHHYVLSSSVKQKGKAPLAARENNTSKDPSIHENTSSAKPSFIAYFLPAAVGIIGIILISSYWLIFRKSFV